MTKQAIVVEVTKDHTLNNRLIAKAGRKGKLLGAFHIHAIKEGSFKVVPVKLDGNKIYRDIPASKLRLENIKVYELDFGDTNVISQDIKTITDWIKADMSDLTGEDELNYTITTKMITPEEYAALPEWS